MSGSSQKSRKGPSRHKASGDIQPPAHVPQPAPKKEVPEPEKRGLELGDDPSVPDNDVTMTTAEILDFSAGADS